jgi:hypothetical protein
MSAYPSTVKSWTSRRDLLDLVVANDVNSIYDEVTAIEQDLGAGGVSTSPTWGSTATLDTTTTTWINGLHDRLNNIEAGLYQSYFNRVNLAGGSTIQTSAANVAGLVIKSHSGQTSNLLEFRDSSNSLLASVSPAGALLVTSIDGGTA